MLFFEVDERGCLTQLAKWQGATAPCEGVVVMAKTRSDAQNLWLRYRAGEHDLKRTVEVPGYDSPVKNIICEN